MRGFICSGDLPLIQTERPRCSGRHRVLALAATAAHGSGYPTRRRKGP